MNIEQAIEPCPIHKKSCISTIDTDHSHAIPPLKYSISEEKLMRKLTDAVNSTAGSHILRIDDHSLHCQFRTKVMKFTDKAAFVLDREKKLIHFKSESTKGYYDFGVNRKRMNALLQKLTNI
ncbi:DUF1499 domain-containing protein [Metabacillus sp. GX 13764]|uniref:DUF1499 domain-containing protein n=1 Tax=Metabacillus kandeliae TaxID=2900151 RepID=UPI001E30EA29|nr:DUF1499 domain-containing protein [Metabacillus kandeliae]MCD7033632.1 DUF1499 domain-containing protein [Metabacillus kandeliae]